MKWLGTCLKETKPGISAHMTIGEYELAVLKAIHHAGGSVDMENPEVSVKCSVEGDLDQAVSKLCADEYVEQNAKLYKLTDLAAEYLAFLGMN